MSKFAEKGSPPHMRGKENLIFLSFMTTRITPAHAGKSIIKIFDDFEDGDHPRTCGEKSGNFKFICFDEGSPPHMRGKVCCNVRYFIIQRITPAHAGKRLDC